VYYLKKEWQDESLATKNAVISYFANLCGQSGFSVISAGKRNCQNWNRHVFKCSRGVVFQGSNVSFFHKFS
jgi:hypothetical protein